MRILQTPTFSCMLAGAQSPLIAESLHKKMDTGFRYICIYI